MAEHAFITQQEIGTQFCGIYYVASLNIKKARNNKEYMELSLKDKSGSVFAKFWGIDSNISKGDYIFVNISVEDYQGSPSYIVRSIEQYNEDIDESLYVPIVENKDNLINEFAKFLKGVDDLSLELNSPIGKIVSGVFSPSVKKAFYDAPSSTLAYYGKVGGALENTVNICKVTEKFAEVYRLTNAERLVLMAGALMSRVSCIETYEMSECAAEETKTGSLIGLKNLTVLRFLDVWKNIDKSKEDREWFLRLLHVISSDENSTTKPATKEAILLKNAVEMDIKMSEMLDYINREEHWEKGFSSFDSINKRRYYVTCEE